MAPRLILAPLTALALSGCINLVSVPTENALEMHRNALRAYDSGEDAKAESLFLGLLRISPNDAETWLRLGNLYARSDRPDNAAEAYQRALLLAPHDSRLWYNLGVIRQRQAHAAYIQAHQLSQSGDEIHERSERLLKQMAPAKHSNDNTTPEVEGNAPSGK